MKMNRVFFEFRHEEIRKYQYGNSKLRLKFKQHTAVHTQYNNTTTVKKKYKKNSGSLSHDRTQNVQVRLDIHASRREKLMCSLYFDCHSHHQTL